MEAIDFAAKERANDTRNELIRAGIHELHEKGIEDFSIRSVAAACGVSCAAPYRHFKNKEDFINSIIGYVKRKWYLMQNMILSEYTDVRERLTEISVAYVRFLVENPDFYSILMRNLDSMDGNGAVMSVSLCTRGLIKAYCNEVNMSESDRVRKTYIVRSLIYGAATMIIGGELPPTEDTFDMIRYSISREFELG